ncbi:MAG: PPC domain-containing DNA-binding protein [Deltaproteobacteria bacterium]
MKYSVGEIGRTIIAKIEHGDDLLESIKELARKEHLESAVFFMLGALKSSKVVVGPREAIIPPEGMPRYFEDGREILAIGTIFVNEQGDPLLHIHGAMGREESVLVGCLRDLSQVYLVVELIIMELKGTAARRLYDPDLLLNSLSIMDK